MAADEIFENFPVMLWTVRGRQHPIPAAKITRTFANRLAPHKRPYRKGARHDNTGPEPVVWVIQLLAFRNTNADDGGIAEPGIPADFYPNGARALVESAEEDEVGDLVTPHGVKRCWLSSGTSTWDNTIARDAEAIELQYVEDNEDDSSVSQVEAPNVRVAGPPKVDAFLGFANLAGAGGGNMFDSIKELMADLRGLAEFPNDALGQMVSRVEGISHAAHDCLEAYASAPTGAANTMRALMTDPFAGPALRKLEEVIDIACRAPEQAKPRERQQTVVYYPRIVSIFDVAAERKQDAEELMQINSRIFDFIAIPPRTPIHVWAAA